ncbi:hypothetical protein [Nonomuraea typhae]|uniref:hypothetical protein n=1 Tax=Nonomuraea typhae TaxID=2603600 RepID=UPI0012F9B1CB|nr:hypothetical protein [Nonomuraea typhae]
MSALAATGRLCEVAGCDSHDARQRSACGIVYVCPSCWESVEALTAILYPVPQEAEAARLAEQAGEVA